MKPVDNQPLLVRLNLVILRLNIVLITVFLVIDHYDPFCLICQNEDTGTCMNRITVTNGMTR